MRIDVKKLTDKQLAELPGRIKAEITRRKEAACDHFFLIAWDYHRNTEDNYSVCKHCDKMGTVAQAQPDNMWAGRFKNW